MRPFGQREYIRPACQAIGEIGRGYDGKLYSLVLDSFGITVEIRCPLGVRWIERRRSGRRAELPDKNEGRLWLLHSVYKSMGCSSTKIQSRSEMVNGFLVVRVMEATLRLRGSRIPLEWEWRFPHASNRYGFAEGL